MILRNLQKCIEKKKANNSQAREVIFRVLMDTDECLNVPEILSATKELYPKRISLNTVYRHLNFFLECQLIVAIQNENKKAHYCLLDENQKFFTICPKCGRIEKMHKKIKISSLEEYAEAEYITIHKTCQRCI